MSDELSKAIKKLAEVHDKRGGEIADALESIATQLKYLGSGNASTEIGAIEGLGIVTKEAIESLSSAVHEIAESLDRHGEVPSM